MAKQLRTQIFGVPLDNEGEDENVASFRDAKRKQSGVSWEGALGDARLAVRNVEKLIETISAVKPRTAGRLKVIQILRRTLDDLKSALAMMEALPPWHPPSGGGDKRIAA